jgi:hypothetical protein
MDSESIRGSDSSRVVQNTVENTSVGPTPASGSMTGVEKSPKSSWSASDTGKRPAEVAKEAISWMQNIRLGRGIIMDLRARAPWYRSDWTDAWNYRVLPATALIFFAKCV